MLLDINLISFGYIARLSQWGGGGYLLVSNDFCLPFAMLRGGGGTAPCGKEAGQAGVGGGGVKSLLSQRGDYLSGIYMRRSLVIYDCAVCAPDPSEFPNICGKFYFIFYQCNYTVYRNIIGKFTFSLSHETDKHTWNR